MKIELFTSDQLCFDIVTGGVSHRKIFTAPSNLISWENFSESSNEERLSSGGFTSNPQDFLLPALIHGILIPDQESPNWSDRSAMIHRVDYFEALERWKSHCIILTVLAESDLRVLCFRRICLNVNDSLIVSFKIPHLLDCCTVVLDWIYFLYIANEVLGLYLVFCTCINIIVLYYPRYHFRLGTLIFFW